MHHKSVDWSKNLEYLATRRYEVTIITLPPLAGYRLGSQRSAPTKKCGRDLLVPLIKNTCKPLYQIKPSRLYCTDTQRSGLAR